MPKPLTIGIDVRDLRIAKTGTKTYLEELCREFKKLNSNSLHFYFLDTAIPVYTGDKRIFKLLEHLRYQVWKQLVLPFKAFNKNCDIVFCTDNFAPLIHLGYKTIPVFHDAFFFETPENYGKLWLWLYKKTALPAARRSPFIITPTDYAKKQIHHFTNIPDNKLVVVYEGPKALERNETIGDSGQLLKSFSITNGNYILHVGSMYKRKNIPALIYAFDKLKKNGYPELKLVLAGPFNSAKVDNGHQLILDAIKSTHLEDQTVLTGYLPDYELAQLYKNALMYVFPSINEGFGIPVLEAFKYDLPVLVANNTCLPEVGGDAVLQFDPFDINDIAEKIQTVLDNPDLQQEMVIKGRERLKNFSWHQTAVELIGVFKTAANYS